MSKRGKSSSGRVPLQSDVDHRAKQLNRNNDEYWKSRGLPARPDGWETVETESKPPPKQGK